MIRRHYNWSDIPPDRRLRPEDGWLKMEVRWMVTREQCGAEHAVVGHTFFPPAKDGQTAMHDLHTHPNAEEIIYVLRGTGRAISGSEEFQVGPGSIVFVPKGDRHLLENTSLTEEMEILFVYGGAVNLDTAGYEPLHRRSQS